MGLFDDLVMIPDKELEPVVLPLDEGETALPFTAIVNIVSYDREDDNGYCDNSSITYQISASSAARVVTFLMSTSAKTFEETEPTRKVAEVAVIALFEGFQTDLLPALIDSGEVSMPVSDDGDDDDTGRFPGGILGIN